MVLMNMDYVVICPLCQRRNRQTVLQGRPAIWRTWTYTALLNRKRDASPTQAEWPFWRCVGIHTEQSCAIASGRFRGSYTAWDCASREFHPLHLMDTGRFVLWCTAP